MRATHGERRLCLMLLAASALLGACGPEPRWNAEGESPWDAAEWRQRLEAHAEATARMLPVLAAAARAEDPGAYRDTLRTVYAPLQVAEESVPPIPWGVDLPHAELHSKYESAVRELRYGAEVMVESLITGEERRRDEARYFIDVGVRHLHAVREQMEQISDEPTSDTSVTAADPYRSREMAVGTPTNPVLSRLINVRSGIYLASDPDPLTPC